MVKEDKGSAPFEYARGGHFVVGSSAVVGKVEVHCITIEEL